MMDNKKEQVKDGFVTAGKGIAWFGAIMVGFREIGKAAGHAADSFREWWESRKPKDTIVMKERGWWIFKKKYPYNVTQNKWEA